MPSALAAWSSSQACNGRPLHTAHYARRAEASTPPPPPSRHRHSPLHAPQLHFHTRQLCCSSTTSATSSSATAPAAPAGSSPPPAEIEATCLRCTLRAISGPLAEELGDVLLTLGAQSVVVQEHRPPGRPEQEIYDDGEARLWDSCDLLAYFPLEADVESTLALAAEAVGAEAGADPAAWSFDVEPVANEAWVEQIKASYVPLQLSEDLWVIPEWSEPADPAATNIILQPGVAFGTGEHPTTRLCLRELRGLGCAGQLAGASVCDYGTGSGVLAIAALKYGAARAVGTDIDSLAVKAAQRNGALNGFEPPLFTVFQCGGGIDEPEPLSAAAAAAGGGAGAATSASGAAAVTLAAAESAAAASGSGAEGGAAAALAPAATGAGGAAEAAGAPGGELETFDLVVANILRGPLVELQPRLAGYVRPGGRLLLSGILAEQAGEVAAAYAHDFTDFAVQTEQQWALLTATKRSAAAR